jgi:predicted DNA-binding transcriptional regulator AlpA
MSKLLHLRAVCARYGISDRTVDRWVEAGELPQPIYIQGRRYWEEATLAERDEARKTDAALAIASAPRRLGYHREGSGKETGRPCPGQPGQNNLDT